MDPHAFDRLARAFSHSASRRRALGGLLAGALTARLPALDGASAALARGKPGARGGHGQPKVAVCHDGRTLLLPLPAAPAHLAHGDRPGPCAAPGGGGGCIPLGGLCSVFPDTDPCCDYGRQGSTACGLTAVPLVSTCQAHCVDDAACRSQLGLADTICLNNVVADLGCVTGNPNTHCCARKFCAQASDCQSGICCQVGQRSKICCLPGEKCGGVLAPECVPA